MFFLSLISELKQAEIKFLNDEQGFEIRIYSMCKEMQVRVTCKYDTNPIKNSLENVMTDIIFPIISLWDFFQRSRAANSEVRDLAEF